MNVCVISNFLHTAQVFCKLAPRHRMPRRYMSCLLVGWKTPGGAGTHTDTHGSHRRSRTNKTSYEPGGGEGEGGGGEGEGGGGEGEGGGKGRLYHIRRK